MKSVPRLYNTFLPKHYEISLTINRKKREFEGAVTITGTKPNHAPIVLHSKDLIIHETTVDGVVVATTPTECDGLQINGESAVGGHTITIRYSGHITNTMHGLYPCYYEDDGEKKELLMTQFESHHAREVFPCIDEPEAKATFQLTIETEQDQSILSNTPVEDRSHSDHTTTVRFETTPRMSTYLLAFVIGDLHRVSATSKSGIEVSIYSTSSHPKKSLEFSLDIATRAIDFFESYFGVPYPLKKSDHVAVPDFSAGAMENWGLITYRERVLLIDEKTSQSTKELVASVICHELSHQWFGNLVTMKWWDDLWLNESFANMMEYVAVDALEPSWNIWQLFASHETAVALSRDHISGVQPVKVHVHHPDEITVLFDPAIVYAKGSRLLRMLQSYVSEDVFKKGLHHYFTTHAYGNTTSDDLWRSLEKFTDKDVGKMMTPWLSQSGFPVVHVRTTNDGYRLKQQRLIIGGHDETQLWPVPLAPAHAEFPDVLSTRATAFPASHQMPYLNVGSVSHFVANYDTAAFEQIMSALDAGQFSTLDRIAILFESSLLARSAHMPPAFIVELLSHYKNETEEPVWNIIAAVIADLRRYVELSEAETDLRAFVQELALPLYAKLGTKDKPRDTDATKKLRAVIADLLLYAEYRPLIDVLLEDISAKTLRSISGDMRTVVYSAVATYGTRTEFSLLLHLHNDTTDPHIRFSAADALTSTKDPDHIAVLLLQLTQKELVKPQDIMRWFLGFMKNASAREDTWQWMVQNWDYITETFAGDKIYDAFPRYSAAHFNSRDSYEAYRAFFDSKITDVALRRVIEIGRRELDFRSKQIEQEAPQVADALRQKTIPRA
jgi:aminopeptidase N